MGFKEILQQIEEQRDKTIKSITSDAKAQITKIEEETANRKKEIKLHSRSASKDETMREMEREVYVYRVEAKKLHREAVNELVNGALKQLAGNLEAFSSSPKYQKLLSKILAKVKTELGQSAVVYVRKEDLEKVKRVLPTSIRAEQSKDDISGGIKAVSQDGRLSMDFSLESIAGSLQDKLVYRLLKEVE